jgi:hypothetical protein
MTSAPFTRAAGGFIAENPTVWRATRFQDPVAVGIRYGASVSDPASSATS